MSRDFFVAFGTQSNVLFLPDRLHLVVRFCTTGHCFSLKCFVCCVVCIRQSSVRQYYISGYCSGNGAFTVPALLLAESCHRTCVLVALCVVGMASFVIHGTFNNVILPTLDIVLTDVCAWKNVGYVFRSADKTRSSLLCLQRKVKNNCFV